MFQPEVSETGSTLYELGRLALTFALILFGIWVVLKLMLRSAKKVLRSKGQKGRRTATQNMKRKHRRSARERRRQRGRS